MEGSEATAALPVFDNVPQDFCPLALMCFEQGEGRPVALDILQKPSARGLGLAHAWIEIGDDPLFRIIVLQGALPAQMPDPFEPTLDNQKEEILLAGGQGV